MKLHLFISYPERKKFSHKLKKKKKASTTSSKSMYKNNKMIPRFNHGNKQASMILNDNDVIIEILSRLPLLALLRFKSVCKWWYHLISDPIFISNYTRRNPHHRVFGLFLQKFFFLQMNSDLEFITLGGKTDAAPEPSLSFIEDESGVCIDHSSRGLLICSSFRCHETDRTYYVCKPTTKQYIALPRPGCQRVIGINIAFDARSLPPYQVICICDSELSSHHRQIKIYSPRTGSWRLSGKPFIASDDLLFKRGVYWRGALHWVGKGKLSLWFDIEQELLFSMPMPPITEGRKERRLMYFGESGGHLYLIQYDPQATFLDVLEMSRDHSGWFVKYHVDLGAIAAEYSQMLRGNVPIIHSFVFSVLHILHRRQVGENEEESFMMLHIPGKFILYNFTSHTFMEFGDIPPPLRSMDRHAGLRYTWEEVFPYSNTLCFL
ncbi:hypothetical protein L1049_004830 [Liquidambar formosana]|uniref:F-box domain-containing protein n=1 Tax=Liquidambar formosana TaxID=63359 RepID=A0AAP0RNT3_LIQFO